MTTPASPADPTARQRRGYWLRTLHQWHWISAAICLVGTLLFAITGITLNHAASIGAEPKVTRAEAVLTPQALAKLRAHRGES